MSTRRVIYTLDYTEHNLQFVQNWIKDINKHHRGKYLVERVFGSEELSELSIAELTRAVVSVFSNTDEDKGVMYLTNFEYTYTSKHITVLAMMIPYSPYAESQALIKQCLEIKNGKSPFYKIALVKGHSDRIEDVEHLKIYLKL